MTAWNKSKKFETLKKRWYSKLAKSGFVDAEQDEEYLNQFSGKITGSDEYLDEDGSQYAWDQLLGNQVKSDAKAEYFRWCRHRLNDYNFKTKRDQKVFEMHSEGLGERAIAKNLNLTRGKIAQTLKRLFKGMKK